MVMKKAGLFFLSALIIVSTGQFFLSDALNNGLAKTPPMGWNSWNIFHENINETQIKQIADAMVTSGMKDAGYIYLNLDDNWMATSRDADGKLRADPVRFPSGMKALGDYIHSKGLKFGIYGDRGLRTCHHYHTGPQGSGSGSYGKEQLDANTFAEWGVDYLKYDNCDPAPGSNQQIDYENMRDALANCGRDIVFSICAWGYQNWMPSTGNLWRTTGDITDKWDNGTDWFVGIINAIDMNAEFAPVAGPGGWNDPDMLEIGNGGCTTEEYRTQMSMWCMMAAPLIAGHDVRNMSQATKDILLNKEVIAVNQDPAGIQGTRVKAANGLDVWCKPLGSINGTSKAVALLNRNESAKDITVIFSDIGLSDTVTIRDLWAKADRGSFTGSYTMTVPSHGTGLLLISSGPSDPISAFANIEAENFSLNSGIQTETCSEGGENIGYIQDGAYAVYNNIDFKDGTDGFIARVACGGNGGNIEIRIDSINGTLAGICEVTGTDDWQTWSTISCSINAITGEHDLYLVFTGDEGYLFNVNWFRFASGNVGSRYIISRPAVNGSSIFKTSISNRKITIIPRVKNIRFSISLFDFDGRVVTRKKDLVGTVSVPVAGRGIYILNLRCNGNIEKKLVSVF
ncbi:MAG: carbohydrate-binding protein [Fibrobacter sp.]|nr:carbohydrate-binding protein [Fibrobacter sp.]